MPKGDNAREDPTVRYPSAPISGSNGEVPTEPTRLGHPIEDQKTILGEGLGAGQPDVGARTVGQGATIDLSEFKRVTVETGLLDARQLERIATEAPGEVLALARALVKAGMLTAYQAAAVNQGKIKGLFIGKYIILDKLGAGGMGVVFKAKHRRLGRIVALKMLPPSFARDRDAVERFRREVDVAAKLSHPNIVAALDADEDRGVHFLVMDYIEGRDLDRLVGDRGALPVAQALDCVVQAARGLDAAHTMGIVHRDIKPGNLMLDASGTVRVLDLGLARVIDANNPFGHAAGGGLTQSGAYMGTVDYMAPEQAEDSKRADHRADIYSLGCTLHFLLIGKCPFDGPTVLKRLLAHQERPAPSLRVVRSDASQALDAVYLRMMAKRPGDRPQSMKEVIALLECARISEDVRDAKSGLATTFAERVLKKATARQTVRESSMFARPNVIESRRPDAELTLEDLVMDFRAETHPEPLPAASLTPSRKRFKTSNPGRAWYRRPALWWAGGAVATLVALFVFYPSNRTSPKPAAKPPVVAFTTIFDGSSPKGWMLDNGFPLLQAHIQPDGLNPRATGKELVVFEKKLGDFVLDFDYKLSKDCDTGVYVRVDHPDQPNDAGIEVSLSDSIRTGAEGSGGFWGLVPPRGDAQKPTGEWNHMTIAAQGPNIDVFLNDSKVSEINLDEWKSVNKRLESQDYAARKQSLLRMRPTGFIAFQNGRGDSWFKNIKVSSDSLPPPPPPPTAASNEQSAPAFRTIFDGVSPRGWMLSSGKPLPLANIQHDGLNPYRAGSYLVVYEKLLADFVLDFDYRLSRGCNSGVFLRVGSLTRPVISGLEVQLDDGTLTGLGGTGGFYGLVEPRVQAQNPSGQWNHMTITAKGPNLSVVLNGKLTSDININIWKDPNRRPQRSDYNADKLRALQAPHRSGYIGFQDMGKDCWFKNIKLATLPGP
jgi:serine/threonine protein kinase